MNKSILIIIKSRVLCVTCPFCCLGDWWNTWHTEGHRGIPWNR